MTRTVHETELFRYQQERERLENLKEKKQTYGLKAVNYDETRVKGGKVNVAEKVALKQMAIDKQIEEQVKKCNQEREKLSAIIKLMLKNPNSPTTIITGKYLLGESWEKVAELEGKKLKTVQKEYKGMFDNRGYIKPYYLEPWSVASFKRHMEQEQEEEKPKMEKPKMKKPKVAQEQEPTPDEMLEKRKREQLEQSIREYESKINPKDYHRITGYFKNGFIVTIEAPKETEFGQFQQKCIDLFKGNGLHHMRNKQVKKSDLNEREANE